MNTYLSLASFPGISHLNAINLGCIAVKECHLKEHGFDDVLLDHVQICPQNSEVFDLDMAGYFVESFPNIQFRLHANVRVDFKRFILDVSDFDWNDDNFNYWKTLASISKLLKAKVYTLHAGHFKDQLSHQQLFKKIKQIEDLFECDVGIEGHYPLLNNQSKQMFYLSTWDEYRELFEYSDCKYVIDLSHFNIIAHKTGCYDLELLRQMMEHPRCLEIHVSSNDGTKDSHKKLKNKYWWYPVLKSTKTTAIIFSEGNHLDCFSKAELQKNNEYF